MKLFKPRWRAFNQKKNRMTKLKHPTEFGGRVMPFRYYWHDGIQYDNSARFDSDEQIDAWLDANPGVVRSARTFTADGFLTVYWN